jgi:MFS family permease
VPAGLESTACPYLQQQARKHSLDSVNEETTLLKAPEKTMVSPERPLSASNDVSSSLQAPGNGCVMPGVLEQTPDAKRYGFWRLVGTGILLAFRNPFVMLAYLGGFVARGDSVIITLFLPLWVNAYYTEHNLCEHANPSSPLTDPTARQCNNAYRTAFMYSGIAQTCALVGAPLFGFVSSRFKHGKVAPLLVASIISALGYTSLFFVEPSQKSYMFPLMCLIGFGEIGMIVTSLCLITSNRLVKAEVRGSVSGTYSLMGVLGTLVSTKVGGLLFDAWDQSAPFLVMGMLSCVTMLWSVGVFGYERWRLRHRGPEE